LYEAEESSESRTQGGSLDLHPGPNSGLAGIKLAGLEEEFNKYARPEGDEKRIMDKDGFVYLNLKGKSARPEIDRR
jgi:hypothetical protein